MIAIATWWSLVLWQITHEQYVDVQLLAVNGAPDTRAAHYVNPVRIAGPMMDRHDENDPIIVFAGRPWQFYLTSATRLRTVGRRRRSWPWRGEPLLLQSVHP